MPRPQLNTELIEAGKRMADQINGRLVFSDPFELRHSYMAFRLQDGTTDGTVYDSLADAKKHTDQWKSCYFAFLNYLGGIHPYECSIYLAFHRQAREANLAQADGNAQAFMSIKGHDTMSGLN